MMPLLHNLTTALRFFHRHLTIGLHLSALGWLILLLKTGVVAAMPHPEGNYVQRWWLFGALHVAPLTAAMFLLFGKALLRLDSAAWVPGWRQGVLTSTFLWCVMLVVAPFLVSGIWAWIAGEPWDMTSFAWLLLAVCISAVFVSFFPPLDSMWSVLSQFCIWLLLVEGTFFIGFYSKKMHMVRTSLDVLFGHPWAFAAVGLALAATSFLYMSRRRSFAGFKWPALQLRSGMAALLPVQGQRRRRRALLAGQSSAWYTTGFNLSIGCWMVGIGNAGEFVFAYMGWYAIMATGVLIDPSLPRQAAMLVWLPGGLARRSLGSEVFWVVLSRCLVLAVQFLLGVAVLQWLLDKSPAVWNTPENIVFVFAYAVFCAGWGVWSYRAGRHPFKRGLIAMGPTYLLLLLAAVAYFLLAPPHQPSAVLQIFIAGFLVLTGMIIGTRYSSHWGRQEISALLKPLKTRHG